MLLIMHTLSSLIRLSVHCSLLQDVSSGLPVEVQGTDGLVYGMEIDLEQVKCLLSGKRLCVLHAPVVVFSVTLCFSLPVPLRWNALYFAPCFMWLRFGRLQFESRPQLTCFT
jgi:hypothetical protein